MSDLFDLSGRTAVVTGSSRGIGLAIAHALLRQGANVVINGHDPDETDQAAQTLQGTDAGRSRVASLPGDITQPQTASDLVEVAVETFGTIHHLVCNAGIDLIKPAVDYQPDEWDHIMAVNLRGVFLPAQAAARHWIAQSQPGSITMTSSIAARSASPHSRPTRRARAASTSLLALSPQNGPLTRSVSTLSPPATSPTS